MTNWASETRTKLGFTNSHFCCVIVVEGYKKNYFEHWVLIVK